MGAASLVIMFVMIGAFTFVLSVATEFTLYYSGKLPDKNDEEAEKPVGSAGD